MDTPTPFSKTPEAKTLFPAKQVPLLSGEHVTIEPWGLTQGMLLAPRVGGLFERLKDDYSKQGLAAMIRDNQVEVIEIVRETIGWSPEEMEARLKYEDVIALAQGVLEVCVMRGEDVGGVVGKVMALGAVGHLRAMAESPKASTSPDRSSSS